MSAAVITVTELATWLSGVAVPVGLTTMVGSASGSALAGDAIKARAGTSTLLASSARDHGVEQRWIVMKNLGSTSVARHSEPRAGLRLITLTNRCP